MSKEVMLSKLFSDVFGEDLKERLNYLKSEVQEAEEALNLYLICDSCSKHLYKEELIKEIADVQSILTQITVLLGSSFDENITMSFDKLLSRIDISSYKGKNQLLSIGQAKRNGTEKRQYAC